MRSLIDFGEADVWQIIEWREDLIVLVPTQMVAEIPSEKVRFLIERCFEDDRWRYDHVFAVRCDLGVGEYTFRLIIDGLTGEVAIRSAADFPIYAVEYAPGIKLARALCVTLPRNLILRGSLHDAEWLQDIWDDATPEKLNI